MNSELREVVCIVDRSGSMAPLTDDVIGGFNTFLAEQRLVPGFCKLTYVQFDDVYEIVHNGLSLEQVEPLTKKTYKPRGATALLDAVGRTIDEVGVRLARIPESERPGKVIVVIITDGHENASREYNRSLVKSKIEHQSAKYQWDFFFFGANVDAFTEAGNLGIHKYHAFNFTPSARGVNTTYKAMNYAVAASSSGTYDHAVASSIMKEDDTDLNPKIPLQGKSKPVKRGSKSV